MKLHSLLTINVGLKSKTGNAFISLTILTQTYYGKTHLARVILLGIKIDTLQFKISKAKG